MSSHRPRFNPENSMRELQKEHYLKSFVQAEGGKTAELFKKRLQIVYNWIHAVRPYFTQYKLAEKEYGQWISFEKGLPESKEVTTLSLETIPQIEKDRSSFIQSKKKYYEAVSKGRVFNQSGKTVRHQHSHNKLNLSLNAEERKKILGQLNEFTRNLGLSSPNFEPLIFPDTFSMNDADLADPRKKIDFPFMDYYLAINSIINKIDLVQRTQKSI